MGEHDVIGGTGRRLGTLPGLRDDRSYWSYHIRLWFPIRQSRREILLLQITRRRYLQSLPHPYRELCSHNACGVFPPNLLNVGTTHLQLGIHVGTILPLFPQTTRGLFPQMFPLRATNHAPVDSLAGITKTSPLKLTISRTQTLRPIRLTSLPKRPNHVRVPGNALSHRLTPQRLPEAQRDTQRPHNPRLFP